MSFYYGKESLTVGKAMDLARGHCKGFIDEETRARIQQSTDHVAAIVADQQVVYGVNTGFGPLCDTRISESDTQQLQYNILQSHAVGVGNPIPEEISKLMLITKVQALAQGFSGVQWSTLERILWHIENNIIPVVPEKGSVGASGDLAPLSHMCLPLIGLGEVWHQGKRVPTATVLQQFQLNPITLGPKEGLALINGTQFMLAFAVKALHQMHILLDTADIVGAMSLEGLMGTAKPFDARLHALRPYEGNQLVAHRLHQMLQGSAIMNAHLNCSRVQDPYSLRCMPPVHGASRNAWKHVRDIISIELNSVTDNPIILGAGDSISGGNFHGQPIAIPMDYATVAAAELGNISDRRSYLMIEGRYGLPKLLIEDAGLNSGFMIPQYTTAALVSENKSLCFPASADSIPTSLGQEDHVSMGSISGRKWLQVLGNVSYILAIELLYAAQAIDFRRPLQSAPILEACHAFVRSQVSFANKDRVFADDIAVLHQMVNEGNIVHTANQAAIQNNISLNGIYASTFNFS
jgi:histidine ammonia-lyase